MGMPLVFIRTDLSQRKRGNQSIQISFFFLVPGPRIELARGLASRDFKCVGKTQEINNIKIYWCHNRHKSQEKPRKLWRVEWPPKNFRPTFLIVRSWKVQNLAYFNLTALRKTTIYWYVKPTQFHLLSYFTHKSNCPYSLLFSCFLLSEGENWSLQESNNFLKRKISVVNSLC